MQQAVTRNLRLAKVFLVDNSPTILTGVGVSGLLSTAVLTAKATFKAADTFSKYDRQNPEDPLVSNREKVELVWKYYIPAASVGVTSAVCIVAANRVSTKRTAALASAYSLTENMFREYKAKVVEQIGTAKETKIVDAIAEDHIRENPVTNSQVVVTGYGKHLFYESTTGRYFESDVESVRKAQNDINAQILNDMYASQNDLFRLLGLPSTGYGDEIGWNVDKRLDIHFSTMMSDDNRPCIVIGYMHTPIRNYDKIF